MERDTRETEIYGMTMARSPVGKPLDKEVGKDPQEWRKEKGHCKFRHVISGNLVEKRASEKASRRRGRML